MVTKQQQLEFAAKHIEKWKSGYDYAVVEETTDGHLCVRWPSICTSGITKKEWQQERDKMSIKPEVGSSWHERGEFPPVGCECEMIDDRCEWVKCDVIAHKDSFCIAWVSSRMSPFYTNDWNEFRPLRTEREKAIEDMSQVMHEHDSIINDDTLGALYDAGYRKVAP